MELSGRSTLHMIWRIYNHHKQERYHIYFRKNNVCHKKFSCKCQKYRPVFYKSEFSPDMTRIGKNTATFFPLSYMSETLHVTFAKDILAIRVTLWENVLKKAQALPKNCKKDVFCRKCYIRLLSKGTLCVKKSLNSQNIIWYVLFQEIGVRYQLLF